MYFAKSFQLSEIGLQNQFMNSIDYDQIGTECKVELGVHEAVKKPSKYHIYAFFWVVLVLAIFRPFPVIFRN